GIRDGHVTGVQTCALPISTYETYKYKGGSATDFSSFSVADRTAGIGDVTAKQWAIGAAIPLGPGKIGMSYAKAKPLEGGISEIRSEERRGGKEGRSWVGTE